jgi:hypothetical protein
MKERIFEDPTSLAHQLTTVDKFPSGGMYHNIGLADVKLIIRFNDSDIQLFFQLLAKKGVLDIEFLNCKFESTLRMNDGKNKTFFENTTFTFLRCSFQNLVLADYIYKGKFKFNFCCFENKQYFHDATFENDIDFFDCKFNELVFFYKVQFEKNINLTASNFHENLLFSYSKFSGLGIFNRVVFDNGLDLSIATINKSLTFFETKIENFFSEKIDIQEERHFKTGNSRKRYDISVTGSGKIPTLNKRETFRIIKNQLEKEGNNIGAFKYNSLEKQAYQQQLVEHNKKWFNNQDAFMFELNNSSNKHKGSWLRGIGFTFIVAVIFLILTFGSTREFWNSVCRDCELDFNVIGNTIKQLINFLNPVHSINYIDELNPFFGIPYVFDFLGRIAVGYGIYQTVQAFRKFR